MPIDLNTPGGRGPEGPHTASCRRALDLIDRLPDEDLSPLEQSFLERHVEGCAACAAEHRAAWTLAGAFASLAGERCPPEVTHRVLAQVEARGQAEGAGREPPLPERSSRSTPAGSPSSYPDASPVRRAGRQPWRPLLAAAALAALLGAPFLASQLGHPPRSGEPAAASAGRAFTVAEQKQAEADLELVFSYLARIGTDTGDILGDQLEQHVVRTTQKALLGGSKQ